MRIDVIQGANLNMLGRREPEIYGAQTLEEIHRGLADLGRQLSDGGDLVELTFFKSNSEGALVDRVQACGADVDAIILNPGAYTHTSVALRDALLAIELPAVEVHLSNPAARESFRHRSLIADVVAGSIVGLGAIGYQLALQALVTAHRTRLAVERPAAPG